MATVVTEPAMYGGERSVEIHRKGESVFLSRTIGDREVCIEFDREEFERALVDEGLSL